MTPLFSIVVPVYNAGAWLAPCVDSILDQSCGDLELILVDDGSSDGSGSLCDAYAARDGRVAALHQANAGPTAARQKGLDMARGEYVCFVDADDWVLPHWLETLRRHIEDNGRPDMVLYDLDRDTGEVAQSMLAEEGYYDKARLEREVYPYMLLDLRRKPFGFQLFPGYLVTKAFRRELVQAHYLQDGRITIFEDTAMSYECVYYASSAYITREKLYIYRRQVQSNLNHYRPGYFDEAKLVVDYLWEHLGRREPALDRQINAFAAYRVIHGINQELFHQKTFSAAAGNVRRALERTGFARPLSLEGLPLYVKPFIFLAKHRLYRPAMLLLKLRALF